MTVKEFNENFWPQYNKTCSFVNCMEQLIEHKYGDRYYTSYETFR